MSEKPAATMHEPYLAERAFLHEVWWDAPLVLSQALKDLDEARQFGGDKGALTGDEDKVRRLLARYADRMAAEDGASIERQPPRQVLHYIALSYRYAWLLEGIGGEEATQRLREAGYNVDEYGRQWNRAARLVSRLVPAINSWIPGLTLNADPDEIAADAQYSIDRYFTWAAQDLGAGATGEARFEYRTVMNKAPSLPGLRLTQRGALMVSARNSYDSCRRSAGYDDGYRAPEPRESLPPIRHDRAPIQRSPAKPTLRGRKTDKPPCRIILVSNTPAFCEWLASIGLSREDRPWSQTMVFLIPEMDTAQIADWVQVHWQSLFESWLTNWVPPESCPPMTYDEFRNFLMWKVPEGEFMLDIYLTGNL